MSTPAFVPHLDDEAEKELHSAQDILDHRTLYQKLDAIVRTGNNVQMYMSVLVLQESIVVMIRCEGCMQRIGSIHHQLM